MKTRTYEYQSESSRNATKKTDFDETATGYLYDSDNNITRVVDYLDTSCAVTKGRWFDVDYRKTKEVKDLGGANLTATWSYDANGLLVSKSSCGGCGGGPGTTVYGYDSRRRVTSVLSTLASDPPTEYYYNDFSNVTKVRAPIGDQGEYAEASSEYNGAGMATKATNPRGYYTTTEYDTDRQATKATDAAGGAWAFAYDLAHTLTRIVNISMNATWYDKRAFSTTRPFHDAHVTNTRLTFSICREIVTRGECAAEDGLGVD